MMASLMRYCFFTFLACLISLASGCATFEMLEPPGVRSQLSPEFDAERFARIAVIVEDETLTWDRTPLSGGVYRGIEDDFVHRLMEKGYTLASRSDIHQIVAEGEFQRESTLTADDAVGIGEMLNVPAVLIVSITEAEVTSSLETFRTTSIDGEQREEERRVFQGHGAIGARLIDVETGEVLWIANHSERQRIPGGDQVGQALRPVAAAVARAFPERQIGESR